MRPLSIDATSKPSFSTLCNSFFDIQFRFSKIIERVTTSYNEPRAIYKNLTNSFLESLPFPSAMFIGIEVAAASICSTNLKCLRFVFKFSDIEITWSAKPIALCHTFKSLNAKLNSGLMVGLILDLVLSVYLKVEFCF